MISLRLPENLETQLDAEALRTGMSKNTIMQIALEQHLENIALSTVPLVEGTQVLEAPSRLWEKSRAKALEQYKLAHKVAGWINNKTMWTKHLNPPGDPSIFGSGKASPGIYGRNIVVGFTEDSDGNLQVISQNLNALNVSGTDRHHLYVTNFDDWETYMVEIIPQS